MSALTISRLESACWQAFTIFDATSSLLVSIDNVHRSESGKRLEIMVTGDRNGGISNLLAQVTSLAKSQGLPHNNIDPDMGHRKPPVVEMYMDVMSEVAATSVAIGHALGMEFSIDVYELAGVVPRPSLTPFLLRPHYIMAFEISTPQQAEAFSLLINTQLRRQKIDMKITCEDVLEGISTLPVTDRRISLTQRKFTGGLFTAAYAAEDYLHRNMPIEEFIEDNLTNQDRISNRKDWATRIVEGIVGPREKDLH